MRKNAKTRLGAILLCAVMLTGQMQDAVTTYAKSDSTAYTGGLCKHHTEHDEDCGYAKGSPCTHVHTDECYTTVKKCTHVHTDACYPEDDEDVASPSGAKKKRRQPTECEHVCSEETGCIKRQLDCHHEHDEECGYEKGSPCSYVCEICQGYGELTKATPSDAVSSVGTAGTVSGNAIQESEATEKIITAWSWAGSEDELEIQQDEETDREVIEELSITWSCEAYAKDETGNWPVSGDYIFEAELPEGDTLADEVSQLEIVVTLGGANLLAENNTVTEGGITITASNNGEVVYTEGSGFTLTKDGSYTISGSWNGSLTDVTETTPKSVITVATGVTADVTLDGVSIDVSGTRHACAVELQGTANIDLTLTGANTLKSGHNRAGLQVQSKDNQTAQITIDGDGSLNVTARYLGAGIGGGDGGDGGIITINGGTITAIVDSGIYTAGAGIGGGVGRAGGTITINGGTVTARSSVGAGIGGGGDGGEGGIITINGGTVTATSSYWCSAGIGGSYNSSGGIIKITGGVINASGGEAAAAIGNGGSSSSFDASCSIEISGGTITATSGYGIGNSNQGTGSTFSTGTNGNAVIIAKSISDESYTSNGNTQGVIIVDKTGTVYGSPTPTEDFEIPDGVTLTIPSSRTLTLGNGVTLTNRGTITVYGKLDTSAGHFNNFGTLDGSGTTPEENTTNHIKADVTLESSSNPAIYNTTSLTLTATVTEQQATNSLLTRAVIPQKTVVFYRGNVEIGRKILDGSTKTASITFTPSGEDWKPGTYQITAEYGGGDNNLLPATSAPLSLEIQLAVEKAKAIIEGGTYTMAQTTANTEGGVKTELARQINALSDMSDTEITVEASNITISSFTAATEGNADTPDGTNGSFSFTVSLSKGASSTITTSKDGTITATAYTGQTNAEAAATAKSVIEGGTYTMAQDTANTEDGVKTELASQINALSGMSDTGITVDADCITITDGSFTAATAGTPDKRPGINGSFTFTVSLTKGASTVITASKDGIISAMTYTKPVITTTSLPDGKLGQNYSQTLTAVSEEALAWSMSGSLPDGLTLNPGTGVISGMPAKAGDFSFTVTATNTSGADSKALTLTIAPADILTGTLTITGTPQDGETLTAALTGTNNTGDLSYRWQYNGTELATGDHYMLKSSDAGHQLTVEVTSSVQSGTISKLTDTILPRRSGSGSSGGSSGGSDSNDNGNYVTVKSLDPTKPDAPTTGEIIIGKADKDGVAKVPTEQITDAINRASKEAQKNGRKENGVAVSVSLPAGTTSATIDRASLDKLITSEVKSFRIDFGSVALTFDPAALKELAAQTTGTVTFSAKKASGLTGDALAVIGTRPAYELSVTYQKDGKVVPVASFGAGSVSVALGYKPAANEQDGGLYAVYVDGTGKVEWLTKSSYDHNMGAVLFATNHSSVFGVGYKTPAAFTDIVSVSE